MSLSLSKLKPEYQRLWDSAVLTVDKAELNILIASIKKNQARYEAVAKPLGIPWEFVAAIHSLESSSNFKTHLHNGDPLTNWTTHVPEGRPAKGKPPFTWEESAIDALTLQSLANLQSWTIPEALYRAEAFNGFGYRQYHPEVLSPYLWSGTNHYTSGKYTADGHFDANAISQQIGVVPLLKKLMASTTNSSSLASLLDVVHYYKGLTHQKRALQWLQASTGLAKQQQFANLYRNTETNKPISFIDAAQYYKGLEYQKAALVWLQANTLNPTIKEFTRLWRIQEKPVDINLQVPYFSQRDNPQYQEPWRICNSSSCAMVLKYLKPGAISDDKEYVDTVLSIGDSTSHEVQTIALRKYGVESHFSRQLSFQDLDDQLAKGMPIPIGILHRGSLSAPFGGHLIVVKGRLPNGNYIVHDPYGDLYTQYSTHNGKELEYSRQVLAYRWLTNAQPGTGWGRIF